MKQEASSLYVKLNYIAVRVYESIPESYSLGPRGTQQRLSDFDPIAKMAALVT